MNWEWLHGQGKPKEPYPCNPAPNGVLPTLGRHDVRRSRVLAGATSPPATVVVAKPRRPAAATTPEGGETKEKAPTANLPREPNLPRRRRCRRRRRNRPSTDSPFSPENPSPGVVFTSGTGLAPPPTWALVRCCVSAGGHRRAS